MDTVYIRQAVAAYCLTHYINVFQSTPLVYDYYTVVQKLSAFFHFTIVSVNADQFLQYLAHIILS